MILVDTSGWISYFKGERRSAHLKLAIEDGAVVTHPFVVGELIIGGISPAGEALLDALETVPIIDPETIYRFIREQQSSITGIGWVDVNLIASAMTVNASLYTMDRKLTEVCRSLGCRLLPGS